MFPPNWDPCSITLALLLRIFILFAWVFLFSKESQGSLLICIVQFSRCCFVFRSLAEHFYYITFRRFCQVLFSSFFKIFFSDLRCSFTDQLFYYITFSSVCQVLFFKFFEKLFWCDRQPFQASFSIISLSSLFVKYFFKFFQNFFPVTRHTLSVQLLYYITYQPLCQVLFSKKSKTSANLTFRSPKTFSIYFCTRSLVRQLLYYITLFFNCQLKLYF